MLERDFQKKVITYLKENKIHHFKTIATNKKGTPDIIGCYHGKFFGIECKSEKGRITGYQLRAHKEIVESGGKVIVIFANENYKSTLDDFFNSDF
ncbi:hypothetical protein HpBT060_15120 [Helicobacter pylori]